MFLENFEILQNIMVYIIVCSNSIRLVVVLKKFKRPAEGPKVEKYRCSARSRERLVRKSVAVEPEIFMRRRSQVGL